MNTRIRKHHLGFYLLTLMLAGFPDSAQSEPLAGLTEMRQLAKNLVETGLYDAAVEAYQEIVNQTPESAQSHYDLAATLTFLRRYDEAVKPIRAAERLDASDPRFPDLAALIYLTLRRYGEAAEASRRGALLGDIQAMYTLSGMYQRGKGVPVNQELALKWTRYAAEGGHLGAMDLLVQTYRKGLFGQSVNRDRADYWAQRLRTAEASLP